jgi:hypothetical protein
MLKYLTMQCKHFEGYGKYAGAILIAQRRVRTALGSLWVNEFVPRIF